MTNANERSAGGSCVSRRAVLVGGATAAACLVTPGVASAQSAAVGVIPTPDRWAGEDLTGFEIRISGGSGGGSGDGGTEADGNETSGNETDGAADGGTGSDGGTPDCDFRDWPPDEVESHSATLVNTDDQDTPEEDTTLYVSADADIEDDAPYLINMAEECETDYVGVELESAQGARERDDDPEEVGEDDPQEGGGPETPDPAGEDGDTPRSGEGTGVFGPGFGVPAAVAAVLGWALLRRRDGE